MRDYVILTDSCCDLSAQMADELGIQVMPLRLLLDDQEYLNYLDGREIGFKEFYDRVRGGSMPTTSALNVGEFEETMRTILETGKDVLYLAFSSGLSTTYQSAVIAAEELQEKYPERKIRVVDTLCAALGQGLLVWYTCKQRDAGLTLDELADWVEQNKLSLCHWVTVNDLMHLKRGGRINATTAVVGTMLQIKPIIHVNNEGKLINVGKARGRKAAMQILVDKMKELGQGYDNSTVFITHGDCLEDGQLLKQMVLEQTDAKEVFLGNLGAVIGSHAGPGTLALFFLGSQR